MDLGIEGRLALVTGCSRGIGRGIAESLAKEGVRLVLTARSAGDLEDLKNQLPNSQSHHIVSIDLMEPNSSAQLTEIVKNIGDLDILVNNLGGSAGVSDPFAPAEAWSRVWHFNLGTGIDLNRAFIPGMIERKWGRIVHISSRAADLCTGNAAYASSKAALNAYVKSVGRALAKENVVLSAVSPGAIYVEGRYFSKLMHENPEELEKYFDHHLPARRLGTSEDVGGVVCFLCSEHASFMTSSIICVDGGGL